VVQLRDCESKKVAKLATEWRALVARIQDRTQTPEDLTYDAITFSRLGMFAIRPLRALNNPPLAALPGLVFALVH